MICNGRALFLSIYSGAQGSPTHATGHGEDIAAHGDVVPTIFGLTFDGHDVNFYFIVNDVLMCFFFGLAAQEITESFIPGGMM